MTPAMKGFMKRKFTPKMAGSVMPSDADSEEGSATDFSLALRHLMATARQAPNWAKLAAEAMGIQMFRPPSTASMPASMTLYMWCRPMTTVQGYSAPMISAPMPPVEETSHLAPVSTQFSSTEKMGPMTTKVAKAVTSTVTSGVTNRSIISGTFLCSHFSTVLISNTASMTGITWPW